MLDDISCSLQREDASSFLLLFIYHSPIQPLFHDDFFTNRTGPSSLWIPCVTVTGSMPIDSSLPIFFLWFGLHVCILQFLLLQCPTKGPWVGSSCSWRWPCKSCMSNRCFPYLHPCPLVLLHNSRKRICFLDFPYCSSTSNGWSSIINLHSSRELGGG